MGELCAFYSLSIDWYWPKMWHQMTLQFQMIRYNTFFCHGLKNERKKKRNESNLRTNPRECKHTKWMLYTQKSSISHAHTQSKKRREKNIIIIQKKKKQPQKKWQTDRKRSTINIMEMGFILCDKTLHKQCSDCKWYFICGVYSSQFSPLSESWFYIFAYSYTLIHRCQSIFNAEAAAAVASFW